MANWNEIKHEYEAELDKAGIRNKEFRSKYLAFARRVNTCRNMVARGTTWDTMCYSEAYRQAYYLLESFNGQGHTYDKPKYWDEYKALCEANGYCVQGHLGDWLC